MADAGSASDAPRQAQDARVLAGVVVFHPDPRHLRELVAGLRTQVAGVMLFLNSAIPDDLRRDLVAAPDVSLIEAATNLGIGVGLNLLGAAAVLQGAPAMIFFDQDSTPPAGLVDHLSAAWAALEAAGHRPAVVSPALIAAPGTGGKAPSYRYTKAASVGDARQVMFVPTSGSLIATDVLRRTGFFRADYFIDGIDLEWSMRAAHLGYSCWVHTTCLMPHTVGSGVIGSRKLGWVMPKQRPFRMYCVVRNTIYGLRLGHVPPGWKARQLAYLLLQSGAFALHHRLSWRVTKLLLLGVRDGIRGRLGPPSDLSP